jgi:hypothetical protein
LKKYVWMESFFCFFVPLKWWLLRWYSPGVVCPPNDVKSCYFFVRTIFPHISSLYNFIPLFQLCES